MLPAFHLLAAIFLGALILQGFHSAGSKWLPFCRVLLALYLYCIGALATFAVLSPSYWDTLFVFLLPVSVPFLGIEVLSQMLRNGMSAAIFLALLSMPIVILVSRLPGILPSAVAGGTGVAMCLMAMTIENFRFTYGIDERAEQLGAQCVRVSPLYRQISSMSWFDGDLFVPNYHATAIIDGQDYIWSATVGDFVFVDEEAQRIPVSC